MELQARKTTHGTVYQCPSCAFLWSDQSTLDGFSDDHARFKTAFEEAYDYKLATARSCPKCNGKLQQGRSKTAGLIFTFCPSDRGVWIDFRTLAVFDRALERSLREQVELAAHEAKPRMETLEVEPIKPNPLAKALKSMAKSLEKTADRLGANMPPAKESEKAVKRVSKEEKKPSDTPKKIEPKIKEEPVVKSVEPLPMSAPEPTPLPISTPIPDPTPVPVKPAELAKPETAPPAEPAKPLETEKPVEIPAPPPTPVKPVEPPKAKPFVSTAQKKPGFFSQLFSGPKKTAQPTAKTSPKDTESPLPIRGDDDKKKTPNPAELPKPVETPKPVPAPKPVPPPIVTPTPKPQEPPKPALPQMVESLPKRPFKQRALLVLPTVLPVGALLLHWLTAYEFEWFYAATWMVWTWSLARMPKIEVLYSKRSLQEFKGRLVGAKEKASMVWHLRVDEKALPLDRHSGWNLAAGLFGVSNLAKLNDKDAVVHGWLRGKKTPYLELRDLQVETLKRDAMTRGIHWTFAILVFIICSLILYSGY